MTPTPQRIQLSRRKGFNLQATSMTLNGLPAVNCARPGRWGNPFKVGHGGITMSIQAIAEFRQWIGTTTAGARLLDRARVELCDKNLACFCAVDKPCHCDVLFAIANAPVASLPPSTPEGVKR